MVHAKTCVYVSGGITWLLTQELPDAAMAFSVTKEGGDGAAGWMPPCLDQSVIRDKGKVMSLNPFNRWAEFSIDPQQRNKDGKEEEEEAFVDYAAEKMTQFDAYRHRPPNSCNIISHFIRVSVLLLNLQPTQL